MSDALVEVTCSTTGSAHVVPIERSEPQHVFLLVWWHAHGDDVEHVTSTLERAQQIYLDERYPTTGPRGGKRPPQPVITWSESEYEPGRWRPSDAERGHAVWSGYYIERREVEQ